MKIFNLGTVPIYHNLTNYVTSTCEKNIVESFELQNNDLNFFSKNFNVLNQLPDIEKLINYHLEIYQKTICGIEIQNFYITDSWIAVTPPGGKHIIHNHPNSLISGIFYFDVPDQSSINFYLEHTIFKNFKFYFDYTIPTDYNKQIWKVPVKNSDIVIFPSWIDHDVDINLSDKKRVIIGFNSFVNGNFGNDRYPTRLFLN
jgi:uncharacterized protein (TIGR02466 family)